MRPLDQPKPIFHYHVTEVLPMSPTQAARFTRAATLCRPTGHPSRPPPGGDRPSAQDDAARQRALASDPPPPRPVTAAPGGPSHDDRGSPASGASYPRRLVQMNQSYGPSRRCEVRPKPSSVPPAMGGS